MKTALVLGAGGFIGSHLVKRLKAEGYWVRGVDLKYPEFSRTSADDFIICDLCDPKNVEKVIRLEAYMSNLLPSRGASYPFSDKLAFDEVYQLAADMGGAGYIFTGENDANIMHNSATINLNVAKEATLQKSRKVFYSSSACVYTAINCTEDSAYPANPDSEYGWEKLFSERLYTSYNRNYGLDVRIARFHNIFGPEGTYTGGKEKAPAALCRKVAEAQDGGEIEIWGDGNQTRSFLYIDECIDGIRRLMDSNYTEPINIGSDEMIAIGDLANKIINISGKSLAVKFVDGPRGVAGRNSNNDLIKSVLDWSPSKPLQNGLVETYSWIANQI
jgi:nucleoside-diphosphate-sugar epimerase